jgi:hypothetical protein
VNLLGYHLDCNEFKVELFFLSSSALILLNSGSTVRSEGVGNNFGR